MIALDVGEVGQLAAALEQLRLNLLHRHICRRAGIALQRQAGRDAGRDAHLDARRFAAHGAERDVAWR